MSLPGNIPLEIEFDIITLNQTEGNRMFSDHRAVIFVCFSCIFLNIFRTSRCEDDDYLNEVQGRCDKTKRPFPCLKYRLLSYVNNYQWQNLSDNYGNSSVRIVDVPEPQGGGLFPEARQFQGDDSEFTKIFKFIQRQVDRVLSTRGLSVELPEGARVIQQDDDNSGSARRKHNNKPDKKMANLIIPLLILFKLFKIKTLVALGLAGIIFIKKTLLVAAFILPSVLQSVKAHCKTQFQVVPHYVEDPHHRHTHEHEDEGANGGAAWSGYANMFGSGSDGSENDWDRYKKQKRLSYGYR